MTDINLSDKSDGPLAESSAEHSNLRDYDDLGIQGDGDPSAFGVRKRWIGSGDVHHSVQDTAVNNQGPVLIEYISELDGNGRRDGLYRRAVTTSSRPIVEIDTPSRVHLLKRKNKFNKIMKLFKKPQDDDDSDTNELYINKWATADLHRDDVFHTILAMRDLIIYMLFLAVLLITVFGPLDYAYNYYATVLDNIITLSNFNYTDNRGKAFMAIRNTDEIWDFIDGILIPVLYTRTYLGGNGIGRILTENTLVGAPQMRQLRVQNNTCSTAPMFRDLYKSCYDYYTKEYEDTESFGLKDSTPWIYNSLAKTDVVHDGKIASYGSGGYIMNFSRDLNFTRHWLNELRDNVWIRQGTRAVFIDFTLYTPNTNLFCMVKLVFEIIPSGGVTASSYFHTVKLLRYLQIWDYFVLSCELIVILFAVYYTFEELHQIYILQEAYLSNLWNILDVTIVVVSYVTIFYGVQRFRTTFKSLKSKIDLINSDAHASFEHLVDAQMRYNVSISVLLFFSWLKLFKFSSLSRTVSYILSGFGQVKMELITLIFLAMIVAMGFAVTGLSVLGGHVVQHCTLWKSIFTFLSLYIGGLYYYVECDYAAPYFAPFFYSAYIVCVNLIFVNFFIAITVQGFDKANDLLDERTDRMYMKDVLYQWVLHILTTLKQFNLVQKLENKDRIESYTADYDAFEKILKKYGCRELELRLLMNHNNFTRGNEISMEKMYEVYDEVLVRNQLFIESEAHGKIVEHLEKISRMIEYCDQLIVDIMSKADVLSDKILKGTA